ncbi:MAG TPA: hypothetical protein VMR98_02790 [Candidatus Polarisedimenticolaceae bacterium]|nr:hypothetical protein [Candidatus Polarisedimenticolaceae bacterium]
MDSLAEPPIDEDEISWCAARIRETTRALIARAQGSPPKIQALQEAGLLLEDEAPLRA